MKYKIISDSSCDLKSGDITNENVELSVVPLFIHVGKEEYTDDCSLDVDKMLTSMNNYEGKTTSSCPTPQSFLDQMYGADKYFIITISSKLSGSANAAMVAKKSFSMPKNVEIIDSESTSGAVRLIIEKMVELIDEKLSFKEIADKTREYVSTSVNTNFVLDKFDNLVKNGRVSKIAAKIAAMFKVKPVCEGDKGEIKIAKKALGIGHAIKTLVEDIAKKQTDSTKNVCVITYCKCVETAEKLKAAILKKCNFKKVIITAMRGLNSFYAMENGFIVCYENS